MQEFIQWIFNSGLFWAVGDAEKNLSILMGPSIKDVGNLKFADGQ